KGAGAPFIDKKTATERLTKYYQVDYIPVNYKRFEMETNGLRDILRNANAHGIYTVVVNMPRSQANDDILPDDFKTKYLNALTGICAESHVTYLNFRDNSFTDDDFSDGLHLTANGSKKFLNVLFEGLRSDKETSQTMQRIKW